MCDYNQVKISADIRPLFSLLKISLSSNLFGDLAIRQKRLLDLKKKNLKELK
jgi:hypothetical protein